MYSDLNAELGVEIGYLFAEYQMPMPEDAPKYFIEGYKEAQHANRRVQTTQYERKVARLRYSAWCRNRHFDRKSVTAEYLESIDMKYCPITRIEMTRGTGQDTDSSVDRTDNNAAYVANNIMFMSVRANKAKGTKTAADMLPYFESKTPIEGLTKEESDRLMYLIVATDSKLVRLMFESPPEIGGQYLLMSMMPMYLMMPNSLTTCNHVTLLQIDFTMILAQGPCKEYKRLASLGDKKSRKILDKAFEMYNPYLQRLERERKHPKIDWIFEDAWRESSLSATFEKWLLSCDKLKRIFNNINQLSQSELQAWHLDTKGYEKL